MKFTYVIIEDNPSALQSLKIALQRFPFLINIGEASTYNEGKRLIVEQRPSLIFLDVELGDKKGYDLINEVKQFFHKLPKVIMTTAHVKYAKESTNNEYLYFIDKPVDYDELYLAIEKFKKIHVFENRILDIKKIDGHHFFRMDEIYYLKAVNNKTLIVKTDLTENEVSKTLKEMCEMLPEDFLRVHKGYVINKNYVEWMNLTKKILLLSVKSGIIELQNREHEIINLKSGKRISIDEKLQMKNNTREIPIGENYTDIIKDSLLVFNKI